MMTANRTAGVIVAGVMLLGAGAAGAQDWPQWRGPNRDGKVTGFTAPKAWPKELTQKWKVAVGEGVATPALVGDKLYVFSREGGDEVVRCLNAADGKEVWKEKYASAPASGAAGAFPGPRGSPTVADGKVVTLGVNGILSCFDAATGKQLWRKADLTGRGSVPRFFTSSSPIILDGLCIAQVGGDNNGALVAYDLATGNEKWKSSSAPPAYASPSLLTLDGTKAVVAETEDSIVAVGAADGKVLWKTPFAHQNMQYNAATPMVEGQTLIYGGTARGTRAVKLDKKGGEVAAKELWSNSDNPLHFNTPVVKNGLLFGISATDKLFCLNAETGKSAWATDLAPGGGRNRGYGSVVDAGSVMFALNPSGQLVVFEPTDKAFKEIAKYKVGGVGSTFAYPVVAGNRIFVKDSKDVTLWTIE
jgi:outer membrane protein assembly factor BamB